MLKVVIRKRKSQAQAGWLSKKATVIEEAEISNITCCPF